MVLMKHIKNVVLSFLFIALTHLYNILRVCLFFGCKNDNFLIKTFDNFLFNFAQIMNCGYTLEPPHLGGSTLSAHVHILRTLDRR